MIFYANYKLMLITNLKGKVIGTLNYWICIPTKFQLNYTRYWMYIYVGLYFMYRGLNRSVSNKIKSRSIA